MTHGGRGNYALMGIPFLFIILGTVGLGGYNASRCVEEELKLSVSETYSNARCLNLPHCVLSQGVQEAEGELPFSQSIPSMMLKH